MDTIFALASAAGKAGVSVIRVSGPRAFDAARTLAGNLPDLRRASLRKLTDKDGQVIDFAIVIAFPEKRSFTGEAVVELQTHGSRAVVSALLAALAGLEGLRQAEPGEFTRRAMENGRLDLAQVEGLADLIDAETEAQRKQAQRVFSGELGVRVESWRTDLVRAAALLEATIDFADEEVPEDVGPEVVVLLGRVMDALTREIAGSHVTERLQHGFEVAIVGKPNVGKSTLLNRLAGRKAAITSEVAGTTRDVIEVRMDLNGLPVTFLDTAGIRDATDAIEGLGVELALERAGNADLRVVLLEKGDLPGVALSEGDITVRAKGDISRGDGLSVSGKTGDGVSDLISRISAELSTRVSGASLASRGRHRQAMEHACGFLAGAQSAIDLGPDHADIAAEELRSAIRALDSLIGRIDVENVLDEIFSSFCLGK